LVAALPQRQLRPSDGEWPGELGIELSMASLGGQAVRLLEQTVSGIEVTAGDIEPCAFPACVHTVGTNEWIPL
jgi:hypothetical protein